VAQKLGGRCVAGTHFPAAGVPLYMQSWRDPAPEWLLERVLDGDLPRGVAEAALAGRARRAQAAPGSSLDGPEAAVDFAALLAEAGEGQARRAQHRQQHLAGVLTAVGPVVDARMF
jgi:hypothetical protein